MRLTQVTEWEMKIDAMCATAAGDIVVRMGSGRGEIQLCDRRGRTHTKYPGLCTCATIYKNISELISGQYLAEFCTKCNGIKVVDMVTHEVHKAYSGGSLYKRDVKLNAMCSGPGKGSLLVWDYNSDNVIELQWIEGKKKLNEVRRVRVPGGNVFNMCYMPYADLVILSRLETAQYADLVILSRLERVVQAVKLQGGADQPPVWQLQGEVLGKKMDPEHVSCDSEGRVYVTDGDNSRVLVLNGYTGEVMQQLLQDAGVGRVFSVCCLSNPHQLLVGHGPIFSANTLSLYNITSK